MRHTAAASKRKRRRRGMAAFPVGSASSDEIDFRPYFLILTQVRQKSNGEIPNAPDQLWGDGRGEGGSGTLALSLWWRQVFNLPGEMGKLQTCRHISGRPRWRALEKDNPQRR